MISSLIFSIIFKLIIYPFKKFGGGKKMAFDIREARENDVDAIWEIFHEVIIAGDTYVFDPNTSKDQFLKLWLAPHMATYVLEDDGKIIGTYALKPNQPDLGSHIANAAYMVPPEEQNRGIGRAMCEHSLKEAKILGYIGMQFNMVVSTNDAAISLWQQFGFSIIGTIPKGFRDTKLGYIDTHIMYKSLE
ncbi:GNAT family N-acetyltransferase [Candidatus Auribacterota bacterium]